jgi:hypothetical protein
VILSNWVTRDDRGDRPSFGDASPLVELIITVKRQNTKQLLDVLFYTFAENSPTRLRQRAMLRLRLWTNLQLNRYSIVRAPWWPYQRDRAGSTAWRDGPDRGG